MTIPPVEHRPQSPMDPELESNAPPRSEQQYGAYPDTMVLRSTLIPVHPAYIPTTVGNQCGAPLYVAGIRLPLDQWWAIVGCERESPSGLYEEIDVKFADNEKEPMDVYMLDYKYSADFTLYFVSNDLEDWSKKEVMDFLQRKDEYIERFIEGLGCSEEHAKLCRDNYKWHKGADW
ncbi:hypothetical protein CVT24_013305 [Panaeolus cyanescens]|uniref:Uncharacterized protein n=1 Tax=Panaeolus cyanescens TaxID=181874 RepID=A0A409YMB9_9AGAR|nr:hypothetical protein CVT24_013305 [Panaeolus cyanescens]